jgi:hypothetical protein
MRRFRRNPAADLREHFTTRPFYRRLAEGDGLPGL